MAAIGVGWVDFLHYMDMNKFLKNLLLQKHWSEFGIISQDCSLYDPFQKVFANIRSVEKYGLHVGRRFSLCGLLQNSFPLKLLVRF